MNNFVAFPGESIISSRDTLTSFVRSVPNQHIDDESLKEYLYRGQDDKNKAVLDTSAGCSYGECLNAQNAEKLEKISQKKTRLGALGSLTLGKIPFQCKLRTTRPQMRFMKR